MRFSLLVGSALASEWEQPSYKEILEILAQQNSDPNIDANVEYIPWGHPLGKTASNYALCPELDIPTGQQFVFFYL